MVAFIHKMLLHMRFGAVSVRLASAAKCIFQYHGMAFNSTRVRLMYRCPVYYVIRSCIGRTGMAIVFLSCEVSSSSDKHA